MTSRLAPAPRSLHRNDGQIAWISLRHFADCRLILQSSCVSLDTLRIMPNPDGHESGRAVGFSGTGRAARSPIFYPGQEYIQFQGYGRAAFSGIPSPKHERRGHVLDDPLTTSVSVLRRVLKQLTEFAIGETFPYAIRLFQREPATVWSIAEFAATDPRPCSDDDPAADVGVPATVGW